MEQLESSATGVNTGAKPGIISEQLTLQTPRERLGISNFPSNTLNPQSNSESYVQKEK
jgi:hypothetical protein